MSKPTKEDAKLLLKLYEMRRDELLRKARSWMVKNFSVSSLEELMENYPPTSDEYAYIEIVTNYWETVGAMIYYGIINEDLFFETTKEHLKTWEKIEPWIEEFRQTEGKPHFLENFELLVERHKRWNEKRVSKLQKKEEFIEKGASSAEEETASNIAAQVGEVIRQINTSADGEAKAETALTNKTSDSGFSESTAEAELEEVLKEAEEEVVEQIAGEARVEAEILTEERSAGEKPLSQPAVSQE